MTAQADDINHAGGEQSEDEEFVHRGLQIRLKHRLKNRTQSMNETQVPSPKVCFWRDSYLVYRIRRDSLPSDLFRPSAPFPSKRFADVDARDSADMTSGSAHVVMVQTEVRLAIFGAASATSTASTMSAAKKKAATRNSD